MTAPQNSDIVEVWCSKCDQPSVDTFRGEAYCYEHDPRRYSDKIRIARDPLGRPYPLDADWYERLHS